MKLNAADCNLGREVIGPATPQELRAAIGQIEVFAWDYEGGYPVLDPNLRKWQAFNTTNPVTFWTFSPDLPGISTQGYNDIVQSGEPGRWIVVGPRGIGYLFIHSYSHPTTGLATICISGTEPRRPDLVEWSGFGPKPKLYGERIAYKAIVRNIGTGNPDDYIFARIKNPATPDANTVGRFYRTIAFTPDNEFHQFFTWNEWAVKDFPSIKTAYTKLVGIGISNQCVGLRADGGVDLIVMNRAGTDAKAYEVALASTSTVALAPNLFGYIGQFVASQAGSTCGSLNRPYPAADMNKDCIVNMQDLAVLVQAWLNAS